MRSSTTLKSKRIALEDIILNMETVVVAYSGGVDSSLVAEMAHSILGSKALIITAYSPSVADEELRLAKNLANERGWQHRVLSTNEMGDERYLVNDKRRCFFCKNELYYHLKKMASDQGYEWVVNGTNTDDLSDYRPGLEAATLSNVRSPLVESGFSKHDVRELARELGLSVWDKPAQPCLASRLPYGTRVSMESLLMVANAERRMHELGFPIVRVRHYGDLARIELPLDEHKRFNDPHIYHEIMLGVTRAGYKNFELDPNGFRSGNLNNDRKINIPG